VGSEQQDGALTTHLPASQMAQISGSAKASPGATMDLSDLSEYRGGLWGTDAEARPAPPSLSRPTLEYAGFDLVARDGRELSEAAEPVPLVRFAGP
jgi:hypothetical protein